MGRVAIGRSPTPRRVLELPDPLVGTGQRHVSLDHGVGPAGQSVPVWLPGGATLAGHTLKDSGGRGGQDALGRHLEIEDDTGEAVRPPVRSVEVEDPPVSGHQQGSGWGEGRG